MVIHVNTKIIKKNIPYLIFAYFGNIFSDLIRNAQGEELIDKVMNGFSDISKINYVPSLNLIDVVVGVLFALIVKLIVYNKGKNARKFRHGIEYGSARWGNEKDIEPFIDKKLGNNILFTETERLTMN